MNLTQLCRSIALAGHRGDDETITSGLTHHEARVRSVALGAADRAGFLDRSTLEPFLDDHDPAVRARAVELVARSAFGAELSDRLVQAVDDPELTELAAFALGELALIGDRRDRAVAALTAVVTDHDDPLCRESAVAALGALGDGLPAVLAATADVATVRRRAVLALAAFDGPDVDGALTDALDDRDWQVRQAAEDLLEPPPG